jgi:hypothetical protein
MRHEYSRKIAHEFLLQRLSPEALSPHPIPPNSEPWIEQPQTISDLLAIAQRAQAMTDRVLSWRTLSSNS